MFTNPLLRRAVSVLVHGLLSLSSGLLACGGASPIVDAEPAPPVWETVVPGAYISACPTGHQLILSGHFVQERWKNAPGQPLTLIERTIRVPEPDAPAGRSPCPGGQAPIRLTADRPMIVEHGDGTANRVSPQGRIFSRAGRAVDWRRTFTGIRDATIDGDVIWAVGADALWRIDLSNASPVPVALPQVVSQSQPRRIFRDQAAIWVITEDGVGWPLLIRGNYADQVGRSGRMAPHTERVRLPLGEGAVRWDGVGKRLLVLGHHRKTILELKSVDAFLPVGRRHALVGHGDDVYYWRYDDGRITTLKSWAMGGATAAFFISDGKVIAVGREYGVVTGHFGLGEAAASASE